MLLEFLREHSIGRNFCGAILLRPRYCGRKCEQVDLVGKMGLCEKQKDLWAGNYVHSRLADLENAKQHKIGIVSLIMR